MENWLSTTGSQAFAGVMDELQAFVFESSSFVERSRYHAQRARQYRALENIERAGIPLKHEGSEPSSSVYHEARALTAWAPTAIVLGASFGAAAAGKLGALGGGLVAGSFAGWFLGESLNR